MPDQRSLLQRLPRMQCSAGAVGSKRVCLQRCQTVRHDGRAATPAQDGCLPAQCFPLAVAGIFQSACILCWVCSRTVDKQPVATIGRPNMHAAQCIEQVGWQVDVVLDTEW